jgi:hypothetical protein
MTIPVKLNRGGMRDLLRSAEVMADLKKRGERIAAAAGPGHEVEAFTGRNRDRVTVRTTTNEAAVAEEAHKNLTNAIGAGK